jgi:hypothetical protein
MLFYARARDGRELVREPKCRVCDDPAAVVAVKQLREQGHSLQAVADRLARSKAAIYRHTKHSETTKPASRRRSRSVFQAKRDGRCPACGFVTDAPAPEALLKRAEWAIHVGEEIVVQARSDEDTRTALQGLDRVHRALELTMKAIGMLQSDASVTVNVDARRLEATVAQLSVDELRALVALPGAVEGDS